MAEELVGVTDGSTRQQGWSLFVRGIRMRLILAGVSVWCASCSLVCVAISSCSFSSCLHTGLVLWPYRHH